MGYVRLRPRRWPLGQNEAAREVFRTRLADLKADEGGEIWYGDESGVLGDPIPYSLLAKKGSRPCLAYAGKHLKDNVVGAVRPADGRFVSLILPWVNTDSFQTFLDEPQRLVTKPYAYLILDNASWHKAKRLVWGKIIPVYLPTYSPDFNPIERIWLHMKQTYFSIFAAKTHSELTNYLENVLHGYHEKQDLCKSIGLR